MSAAPTAAGAGTAAPGRRRRGRETALDMVRTLAVVLAAVVALLLLVPQPPGIRQPGADVAAAAGAAGDALGFVPVAVVPEDLGEGWTASYARSETIEDIVQWRAGYLSPDERRVDVEQARDATVGWLTRDDLLPQVASRAADLDTVLRDRGAEQVDVGGVTWWRFERADDVTALAREADGTVLVVSVSASRATEALEAVAAATLTPRR